MTEHVDIVDPQRHELKGASTASINQIPKSNGDGTTTFGSVDYTEITNPPIGVAVSDIAQGATTTDLENKINELLASLRTPGIIGA